MFNKEVPMEHVNCDLCGSDNHTVVNDKEQKAANRALGASVLVRDDAGNIVNGRNVMCNTCGLIYVTPRMTRAELEHFYTHDYRKYYSHTGGEDDHAANAYKVLRELRLDAGKVLDIGCNTGKFIKLLPNGYGIDPNPEAVATAQGQGLSVECSTIERYSPPLPFDTVTLLNTLEHVASPTEVLMQVRAFLVDNGHVVVSVPNLYGRTVHLHPDVFLSCAHLYTFCHETLTALFHKCGLEPVAATAFVERSGEKLYVVGRKSDDVKQFEYRLPPDAVLGTMMHLQNATIVARLKETIKLMGYR